MRKKEEKEIEHKGKKVKLRFYEDDVFGVVVEEKNDESS